jgi:small subunit ribosomal protein S2
MLNNEEKETKEVEIEDPALEELMKQGVHFGHKTTKKHPKMEQYIFGVRNGVNIIDVSKTKEKLEQALEFLTQSIVDGKTILLVGTKVQLKDLVRDFSEECEIPYINERWLGGTITNFDVIKERVDYLKDLEQKKKEGDLEKYTKKERIKINKEIDSLKKKFDGLKLLSQIPDILFVLDMHHDDLAIKEARMKKVKIIALADTNADPSLADYPIPANDDALPSVRYILDKFKETIKKAKTLKENKEELKNA